MKLKMKNFPTVIVISLIGSLLYFAVLIITGQTPGVALKNASIVCGSVLFAGVTLSFFS